MNRKIQIATICFMLCGCGLLLDLKDARASGPNCSTDADCAPSMRCIAEQCLDITCSEPGAARCLGQQPQVCGSENHWNDHGGVCDVECSAGACIRAKSCDRLAGSCGPDEDDCCQSLPVLGGSFMIQRPRQPAEQRSLSLFALDRFEVTVGRFKQFVAAYDDLDPYGDQPWPAPGAGANPHRPDSGWLADYHQQGLLPRSATDMRKQLGTCSQTILSDADDMPMRCVDWYLATAFCIWDGERLPSELEWDFAAMGGSEQRLYPWSAFPGDDTIDAERARFSDAQAGPAAVGAHPKGRGTYGHDDLAGNVAEWVADIYAPGLSTMCSGQNASPADRDCETVSPPGRRMTKNGAYDDEPSALFNVTIGELDPAMRMPQIGFRCARD